MRRHIRPYRLTSEDATDLPHSRCLWQEAYAITLSEGIWTAGRRDDPAHFV